MVVALDGSLKFSGSRRSSCEAQEGPLVSLKRYSRSRSEAGMTRLYFVLDVVCQGRYGKPRTGLKPSGWSFRSAALPFWYVLGKNANGLVPEGEGLYRFRGAALVDWSPSKFTCA